MAPKTKAALIAEAAELGIELEGTETRNEIAKLVKAAKGGEAPEPEVPTPETPAPVVSKKEKTTRAGSNPLGLPGKKLCKGLFAYFPDTEEWFPCGGDYSRAYYIQKGKRPPCEGDK